MEDKKDFSLVEPTETQMSIANTFGYSPSEIAVIQKSVAKNTTKVELAYFINVCKTMELNPFNKEVWCYKDKKGNLLIFAGRDGFLSKAQKNPLFNGIRSAEVREKDEWAIDIPNGSIKHKITKPLKERGQIILGYSFVFRKGGEPTIEFADFETYNKGYNTWKTHPAEMIKKVAETHALKKAFGISGIQSEYEFNVKNNVATPNNSLTIDEKKKALKNKVTQIDLP
ncbi:phage recombination protein Bet [Tenacibaculum sp. MAR_2009_124]|uniref:RecT family recombinase n=1 Tax=Tenacibaculum sp. MAR_2009_124 TaxID=1250059 RepID=UPI00089985BD|nr:RecT family recombinase [Tenacibaculum sp. MAR_2009_124]SED09440.1 phage recombination protein Bet [Tenacibaculum sp. MAR_2009_124]